MSTTTGYELPGTNGVDHSLPKNRDDALSSARVLGLSLAQANGEACVVCGDKEPPENKKVPAHTGYPRTWSCADCIEAAAKRTGRPWWQNRPCDDWCGSNHSLSENGPDRGCMSEWSASVPLSLVDQERDPSCGEMSPNFIDVYLGRGLREIEPHLVFVVPGKSHLEELTLTLDEGRQLAEALSHALTIADGFDQPR